MRTVTSSRPLTRVVPSLLLIGATAAGLVAADPTISVYTAGSLATPTGSATSVGTVARPFVVFQWPSPIQGFDPLTNRLGFDDLIFQGQGPLGAAPVPVTVAKADVNIVSSTKVIVKLPASILAANGDVLKVFIPAASHYEYGSDPTANAVYGSTISPTAATTNSTTTATFTKTSHGLTAGTYVTIVGAIPDAYNGTYQISNVTANTFDYTLAVDPGAAPANTGASGKIIVPSTVYTYISNGPAIQNQLTIATPADDSQTTDRKPTIAATVNVYQPNKTVTLAAGANQATGAGPTGGSVAWSGGTATITFVAPPALTAPNFAVGDVINVSGVGGCPTLNGKFTVTGATATTVAFAVADPTIANATATTVTVAAVDQFQATDLFTLELQDVANGNAVIGSATFPRGSSSTASTIQVKPTNDLAIGMHRFRVKVKDPVGNYVKFSGADAVSSTVDLLVWDAATVTNPALVGGTLTYNLKSALDITGAKFGIVSNSNGYGPVGSTVSFTVDGQAVTVEDSNGVAQDPAKTGWFARIPVSIIGTPGSHTAVITQKANDGSSLSGIPTNFAAQPSITTTFTIDNNTQDTTAPDQPSISTPLDSQTVYTTKPTISGNAEGGSTVKLQQSSDNNTFTDVGSVTAAANGTWSYLTANWTSDGAALSANSTTYLRVVAIDAAGNISPASTSVGVLLPTDDVTVAITGTGATSRSGHPTLPDGDWSSATSLPIRVAVTKRSGATIYPDAGTLTASDFTVTNGTVTNKTAAVAIGALGTTNGNATVSVTTSAAHGFAVGDTVSISGSSLSGTNGEFVIASAGSATTFTYTMGSNAGATATTATAATVTGVSVYTLTPSSSPVTVTLPASKFTSTITSVAYDNKAASYVLNSDKVASTYVPTISSAGATSTTTVNGSPILTLTFNEAMLSVDNTKIHITATGGGSVTVGAGATADPARKIWTFALTTVGNVTGISLGTPASGTVGIEAAVGTDYAGNTTAANTTAIAAKTLDTTAPTAPTITSTISSASATKTSPIPFTITFPEAVTWNGNGLDVVNGVAGAVTGTGAVYTVNVTPGEGIVKIRLSSASFTDTSGNASTGITTSYTTRTYDSTPPRIVNMASSASSTTKLSDIPFTVTFSEAVSGLATSDFVAENADVLKEDGSSGTLTGPAPFYSLIARVKSAKVGQAGVKVRVLLPAGAVTDGATNTNSSIGELTRTYDGLVPVLTGTPTATPVANTSTVSWVLNYNKSVTFDTSKVVVNGGTFVSATGSPGTAITLTVNYGNAKNGYVGVTLLGGAATDSAGNASAPDSTSVSYTDNSNG